MSLAVTRSSVLRQTALAACMFIATAGVASAQTPTTPSCALEGSTTFYVGEAIEVCAVYAADLDYSWDDPQGNDINSERCLSIPGGLPVGCYTYELTVSNQVGDYEKCDIEICVIDEPKEDGRCWLTGGGQRTVDGLGNWHSYGGNINPGCSETAGDGGNWNDVNHTTGEHFMGRSIRVIRCGNVGEAEHPDGSESPVTPVNFIEFEGEGVFMARGERPVPVFFHGLYEDREEPGSHGQPTESYKDRYFLNVFTDDSDPVGTSVLLVDADGNPATMDPISVTYGNLQMHFRPCDAEVAPAAARGFFDREPVAASSLTLSAGPNPTSTGSTIRFSLPSDGNVSIRIYDIAGRELADLGTGPMSAGQHSTMWNLSDRSGTRVSKGIYFARMTFGNQVRTQHIVVSN